MESIPVQRELINALLDAGITIKLTIPEVEVLESLGINHFIVILNKPNKMTKEMLLIEF